MGAGIIPVVNSKAEIPRHNSKQSQLFLVSISHDIIFAVL